MKKTMKLALAGTTLSVAILATGCSAKHISPSDRDTTGTYDGVWIGSVTSPRASTEILPGNWTMSCEWDPFEIYLVVDEGRIHLGKLEYKTPVSGSGDFRYDVSNGPAGMRGGVMAGNSQFIQSFSGKLSGEEPRGKYMQFITTRGNSGCSAKIRFHRQDSTVS